MKHVSPITALPAALAAFGLAAAMLGSTPANAQHGTETGAGASMHRHHNGAASSAKDRVEDSTRIVEQMKQNPRLAALLERAKGVFIIPHYGKGAFIVGGQGGGGVVLAHRNGTWSDPAFYSIGGGSIGAQAGAEGGSVVMILMTRKAIDKFANSNSRWTLNGNAGLTVATWSGKAQAETGNGDVIAWSNTSGLYGGLTASVTDITPDRNMDHAYYGRHLSARQVLEGSPSGSTISAQSGPLRNALSMRVASK
ncbi:MAG: lipid-binding SYLF domain-containing protein [Steroidobacteraceae bacterium]